MNKTEAVLSRNRLVRTFGAQIYNQAVTIAVQLALVPVLLYFWGTERYGVWILLSAIPTYLTFADLGFTMAAKNVMTIKVAEGNRSGAVVTYQSIFMLLNAVIGVALLLLVGVVPFLKISGIFALGSTKEASAIAVLILLAINVLLTQYLLLFASGLRSAGRPAEEVFWSASARLMEGVATVIAASWNEDIVAAALAIVANRIAFNFVVWLRLRFLEPWLALGIRHASLDETRRLFHPSLSFMLVSIGQALTIQGPVVILGAIGTPIQVVIFSTSRTLARLGTSAINMVNFTFTPEYSRLYGLERFQQFARLARLHISGTIAVTIVYVGTLNVSGGVLLATWTHRRVVAEQPFFFLLLLAVAFEMLWSAALMPLASINQHIAASRIFSFLSIVGLATSYTACKWYDGSLVAVTAPLLGLHMLVTAFVIVQLWFRLRAVSRQFRIDKE
ncbi:MULTISPECIES: hypothetical protein [unclassified Bradyrhizobium]|uniref:lipopolysaccharide biosynthesis protein n=1 Tax=unclassified Bradyrhizobium TaxID=2631580 RepID=UPI001FFBA84A|nr:MULTISPECIES: hypothetical protein [unclassified Bradyrhizobium]MCK1305153.1 teichoic acid transporter [Bradyrhizobium sp. 45]MCK1612670.1 teichoic acid transporter [Bradyrhizobium sp. 163]MCK1765540.1 teichoic acid transporter [Bradyrhizobium sp. 136]